MSIKEGRSEQGSHEEHGGPREGEGQESEEGEVEEGGVRRARGTRAPNDHRQDVEPVSLALSRAAPLRVLPSMAESLKKYLVVIGRPVETNDQKLAARRYKAYETALVGAVERARAEASKAKALSSISTGGLLAVGQWSQEASGRWRSRDPNVQQLANALRLDIVPEGEDELFIDGDYTSAHPYIAATRARDERLLGLLRHATPDLYTTVALSLGFPRVPGLLKDARKRVKLGILALINGGDHETVADHLEALGYMLPAVSVLLPERKDFKNDTSRTRALAAGGLLESWWWATFTELAAFRQRVVDGWTANKQAVFNMPTLTGKVVPIDTSKKRDRGWKTLLSAAWTTVEAEMLAYCLERLHGRIGALGGRLALPMHDGLLVTAPSRQAHLVREEVRALMAEAAEACGVGGIGVDVPEPRRTWGEPK